ncbi:MAG: hypothetical protein Q8K32_25585 [Archangium sp.]|nr:hypothetical protein [Archangium sp.]
MPDSPVETPSVGMSILAAFLALGGLPAGFTVFLVMTREPSSAWNEGGAGMFAIVGLAMLATVVSAVGAFLAPRGVPGVMGAALAGTALLMGVAGGAYRTAVADSFEAIQHASPLDRPIIMRGVLGEVASLVILAAALAAGLLLSQGLSLLVASLASRQASMKRATLFTGIGLLFLGAWQVFTTMNAGAERDLYMAMSHAAPMDRLVLVVDGFARMASSRQLGLGALLAALIVMVAGVLALRSERRAAAVVLFGILVPLGGLGGFRAMARPSAEPLALATAAGSQREMLPLDATPVDERDFQVLTLGTELRSDDGVVVTDMGALKERIDLTTIGVGLEPGVDGAAVMTLLGKLKKASTRTVALVGQTRKEPPGFVPAAWHPVFTERRGLIFDLQTESGCEGCTFSSVTEKGLIVDDEVWPLETSSFGLAADARKVYVKTEGLTLQQVLSLGHTAMGKAVRIVLVLPD